MCVSAIIGFNQSWRCVHWQQFSQQTTLSSLCTVAPLLVISRDQQYMNQIPPQTARMDNAAIHTPTRQHAKLSTLLAINHMVKDQDDKLPHEYRSLIWSHRLYPTPRCIIALSVYFTRSGHHGEMHVSFQCSDSLLDNMEISHLRQPKSKYLQSFSVMEYVWKRRLLKQ